MTTSQLAATAKASNSSQPSPGASGVGDSLYPGFGNGGYDAQHYTVDLNVSNVSTSQLTGKTTIEAKATQSLSSFNLDFIGFNIDSIKVNGKTASYSRDGQELTIQPASAIASGDEFVVEVQYNGAPEQITSVALPVLTGWVNYGDGSFVLSEPDGAANYYPVNDHPLDKASYTFRVTVPEPFEVAANGTLEKTIDNGDSRTYVFEARDPMASYLTTVNISQFDLNTQKGPDGIKIRNYFGEGIDANLLKPFQLQAKMLDYFSDVFGPYPFDVYGSVVMNTETGSALETQTLSIFGLDQLGRNPAFLGGFSSSTEEIVAHELAHQWFGDSVSLADWSDIWLNESFATYAQGLWVEFTQGQDALDQWVINKYNTVVDAKDELVPPGQPPADDLFNSGVYDWGALALHALRLEIGDDAFFDTLQTYYQRYKGGNVTTDDLIAIAEETSGKNLGAFFDSWIYSDDIPAIAPLNLSSGPTGDQTIQGSRKGEVLFGRDGNDTIYGNGGLDVLIGGAGDDTLYGGSQADNLQGGDGNDALYGKGGNNTLTGGAGDDLIYGGSNNDSINAGAGNDTIYTSGGVNTVTAGAGDDIIYSGTGADTINAGAGNDTIYGKGGGDVINSGAGLDAIALGRGSATVVLSTGDGYDLIQNFKLGATKLRVTSTENLSFENGSNGAQILQGDDLIAVVAQKSASFFTKNVNQVFVV
ncbi:MAG TPA: M1 family aminopeptidase [Crinalium sp.]